MQQRAGLDSTPQIEKTAASSANALRTLGMNVPDAVLIELGSLNDRMDDIAQNAG